MTNEQEHQIAELAVEHHHKQREFREHEERGNYRTARELRLAADAAALRLRAAIEAATT